MDASQIAEGLETLRTYPCGPSFAIEAVRTNWSLQISYSPGDEMSNKITRFLSYMIGHRKTRDDVMIALRGENGLND